MVKIRIHQKVNLGVKLMNEKFELFVGQENQYYFHLLSPSGTNLSYSEGYTAKHNAENGIRSVKMNARNISNFTIIKGVDGFYYFNLKAPQNGEILLRSSRKYYTHEDANIGANQVSQYAPTATTSDLTAGLLNYV